MSPKAARLAWGALLGGCLLSLGILSLGQAQNDEPKNVAELIPQDSVLLLNFDGSATHKEAFARTAAHQALFESGLVPLFQKGLAELAAKSPAGPAATEGPMGKFFEHLFEHGVAVSVSVAPPAPGGPPMPLPQALLVLPEAAEFAEPIGELLQQTIGISVESRKIGDRTVQTVLVPDTPGVEVGWWADGGHLVISAGINAIPAHVAVGNGDTPNLTGSPLWKQFGPDSVEFEMTSVAWFDIGAVRDMFSGMPIPLPPTDDGAPVTVADVAKVLGVDNLGAIVSQGGYNGAAMWSETVMQVDGEKRGLLALGDHDSITFDRIPPLPVRTKGFATFSFNTSKFWGDLVLLIREAVKLGPPEAAAQAEQLLAGLPQMLNFDPQTELFDTLGSAVTIYLDGGQDFFGFGGLAKIVEVKDAKTLRKTIDHILLLAEGATEGQFKSHRVEKHGREILTFEFEGVEFGGLTIDDNWLAVGFVPQTVEAFLLRVDGKLDKWQPSRELNEALAELPKEFTGLTVTDPRAMYRSVLSYAPLLFMGAKAGIRESGQFPPDFDIPIGLADLPPTEVIVQPLFPNVMMTVKDENGFRSISRSSLPAFPVVGQGGLGAVATSGILVALLLPAVQQARAAARRSQSKNNLKQIGLALHNYHDVHNQFPAGTVEDSAEEPEDRLSWISSVLPYLDQAPLYQKLDQESGWDSDANSTFTSISIPTLLNPGANGAVDGVTHYVGISGLGKDAPTLPVNHERAGVFGYNRKTRFRDIRDGSSNTIGVTEASGEFGRWAAGGNDTLRSLTQQPYINGPDGIGGPYQGGVQVLLMDGSVRFISNDIDPDVFKALITINGGEVVPPF